jgi:Putative metal-binding motif/Bacterial Ig domain
MSTHRSALPFVMTIVIILVATAVADGLYQETVARPNIRDAFFTVYTDAVGTAIETVPSQPNHCGVCHLDFTGGGQRNPYGVRLGEVIGGFPNNPAGRQNAVLSIENEDPDTDGFSTYIEVTDVVSFINTPTFPGLTPANVGNVTQVALADIQSHLVPSTGGDTTPPDVTVIAPNGGETLTGNASTTIQWTATDASGVSGIDLYLSIDNGATFDPLTLGLPNTGSYTWFPANRPSTIALILVEAIDNAFNIGQDESDSVFTIESPPGGIVPTTLRDFDQPGSQPLEAGILNSPEACAVCHGNYDSAVEPFFNWQGSMMSQASRDMLFEANMVIANQDAPDSGDLCLRCHLSRGWLMGRSVPTDGSQMLSTDGIGVSCDFCHRLVDPFYAPENPDQDLDILAALRFPASDFGNGMATIDPTGARRGPFVDADSGHPVLVSPFHREAALCGTCHDVSNPAFQKGGSGNYVPNAFDTRASSFSAHTLGPVERTYSEWFYSEYNTLGGVYAPQFGGNRDYVATCQDCHMRDVTGQGCNQSPPVRSDLPLHDQTGGSTWLPGLLSSLYPGDPEVDEDALQAGIARARYMLQNAAKLSVVKEDTNLRVTITNNTGHKLPTGYPEGRRIWINVRFYDTSMALISESGAYNAATGLLSHDPEVKIYETEPGLDEVTAPLVGVDPGPSFHFVLNDKIFKDNRIPPRGFTNAAYAGFGGVPVGYSYANGQYWDDTLYEIPSGAFSAQVTLYYQSTSKEFVEFLRDENTTNNKGQEVYDLWSANAKCPPEIMVQAQVPLQEGCADGDQDGYYGYDSVGCPAGTDCDDSNDAVNPGASEIPGNGLDDDCNPATPDQQEPGWSAATAAQASVYDEGSVPRSEVFNHLALLIPIGTVIFLKIRRRQK